MEKSSSDALKILYTNIPIDVYLGLTTNEVHCLFKTPFAEAAPLKLRDEIPGEVLNRIPFFRLVEELCIIAMRDHGIKLTAKNTLSQGVLKELYGYKLIAEDSIESGLTKLSAERNWPVAEVVRIVAENSGVLRKKKGRLVITRAGQRLLRPEMRTDLFREILVAFTTKYDWTHDDGFTCHPVGQFGWAYTVLLLKKYGIQPHPIHFYSELFLKAFPFFLELVPGVDEAEKQEEFFNCFVHRSFERFTSWFGFTEQVISSYRNRFTDRIVVSDLLQKVFKEVS